MDWRVGLIYFGDWPDQDPIAPTLPKKSVERLSVSIQQLLRYSLLPFLSVWLMPALLVADDSKQSESAKAVSYSKDVEPIFRQNCFGCHQGAKQLGSYVMTDFESLLKGGETEMAAVVPGKPGESFLVEQISGTKQHRAEMPKAPLEPLNQVDVKTIRDWIAQGAKDDSPAETGPKYTADNPPIYSGAPALTSIDVSPDGKLVAVAGFHEVILLDAKTGDVKSRLVGLSPRINAVRFSPDGKRLAAVGGTPAVSGEVQIWNVKTNKLGLSLQVTYDALFAASWSPDGTKLAFGAADNVVRAVDSSTGKQVLFQGAHEDWVRDTVFTRSGKHLISVARDMSCKLTEVETERFVDNITSITPGALSGGLNSVAVHGDRNEILVGGADGVAKLYRVFRKTARKIGDDANLIRAMPKLKGRIFSVAIGRDGNRLAAAATLDGKSELRIWKYNFDGKLTADLKAIIAKRLRDRKPEELKKLAEYRKLDTPQIAAITIDDASVYAIRFGPDNSLFVAGNDGKVRHYNADGSLNKEFVATPTSKDAKLATRSFDAKAWATKNASNESLPDESSVDAKTVQSLDILPKEIQLNSLYDYSQLIVSVKTKSGTTVDVTRSAKITVPDFVTITKHGLVRGIANGSGQIEVSFAGKKRSIELAANHLSGEGPEHGAVDFIRDVNPILSRLGCNQGTCHGAQKGKNGFKLSLRGYDPVYDIRALTDDLAQRRINAASPEDSMMLRKPLGLTPHQGGALMTAGDPYHSVLRRWIADGSKLDLSSQSANRIEIFPVNPIVESTTAIQQVRVVAHFPDGSKRDVTQEAFIESGNTEVATANTGGLLQAVRRGEAPILARYEGNYAASTLTVMGDRTGYAESSPESWSKIDELVAAKWKRVKVVPSGLCDDASYLRRVHLDLTGLPPSSQAVREFLADKTPTRKKREQVVNKLLASEAYTEYWTNKWADLLQVNRKFLGVEGSKKFREWIRAEIAANRPYDEFARSILTASGSNNDNPAASYYKILRNPEDTMENTTHLFLGIRFNCNKCHDHPFERWTQDQYYEMSAFFARVKLENDPISGKRKVAGTAVEGAKPLFEKVVDSKSGEIKHPKTNAVVAPTFPFETEHECADDATRRQKLASWMTDPDNPYFARSFVNRLWGYLFGTGLIEPIDDIRAGNPATNPELLKYLTNSFVDSGFNTREMHRLICNSRVYQLAVSTNQLNEDDQLNFSHAIPRRLPAEVIYDAVHRLTGSKTNIPGAPKGTRAAALNDSGVKLPDGFLQNLGRPARESACECERSSELQLGPVMALISGPTIGTAIADPKNELEKIVQNNPNDKDVAEEIFLRALGRPPTKSELTAFATMNQLIKADHDSLTKKLAADEADWKTRKAKLENARIENLATITKQIESRKIEIKPERERLAKERMDRIAAAKKVLDATTAKLDKKVDKFIAENSKNLVEWYPLAATKATATNTANLIFLNDRSILATERTGKCTYTVVAPTQLQNITGFRLEALTDDSLPSKGPGLAPNGNFVITEFEIKAAPASAPKKTAGVKIKSGVADFLQPSFSAPATFDGNTKNQRGWAVSGATGQEHWITYQLEKPIDHKDGTILTFVIHQFHNAAEHRLGRFRISATTHTGKTIPLGYSETLAAAATTDRAKRTESQKKLLSKHVGLNDPEWNKAVKGLATANKPVPPDDKLTKLQARKKSLEQPTKDTASIIRLRSDVGESKKQLKNLRLTAAEDLTWALINSPAFLFNH